MNFFSVSLSRLSTGPVRQFISILLLINSSITLTRKNLDSLFGINNPVQARTRLAHAEPVHRAGDKLEVISGDEKMFF